MMWPTLMALRALGDSGTVQEVNEKASEIASYTDDQLSVLHNKGPQTKIHYRMAWARTYLKAAGLIENSGRGVWSITERGKAINESDIQNLRVLAREGWKQRAAAKASNVAEPGIEDESAPVELTENEPVLADWRSVLLSVLQEMPPGSFEKLSQRLLRECGFIKVEVTGKSGDGGIDGIGVLRIALLSFQVFFQCKRYKGSVGASAIRDFRGAMVGRTDKGLFITTGTFTPDAKREATRDGAPALDLIDGDALCDLLKERRLGVQTEMVEQVVIDTSWFESI
jgi:restriction system protein